jgi:hypothetical protein
MAATRRRELYHDPGIFTAQPDARQKKLRGCGGFQAAFPLYRMNRQKQQTSRRNQNRKPNLRKTYAN